MRRRKKSRTSRISSVRRDGVGAVRAEILQIDEKFLHLSISMPCTYHSFHPRGNRTGQTGLVQIHPPSYHGPLPPSRNTSRRCPAPRRRNGDKNRSGARRVLHTVNWDNPVTCSHGNDGKSRTGGARQKRAEHTKTGIPTFFVRLSVTMIARATRIQPAFARFRSITEASPTWRRQCHAGEETYQRDSSPHTKSPTRTTERRWK
jgi:hypothetical protein